MKTVITFGTFDLFHIGHLRILQRAARLGDRLVVGISTDELNFKKKSVLPIYNQEARLEIVKSNKAVSDCFYEESLELKEEYILKYKADVLVMGDDWKGRFDFCKGICDVVYFPRTENISSTEIKQTIKALMLDLV